MKLYVVLFLLPLTLAQECCQPEQYEAFLGTYFGYTLRNEPDFEPQTVDGVSGFIYDYANQRQKTTYFGIDVPGEENRAYILGDYAFTNTTTRFYTVNDDGSCVYEDFENAPMIPPCFDLIWPRLAEFFLTTDIPAASYGDVTLNNYVMVRLPECYPMINIATRRNQPEEGTYRWETTAIVNMTLGISDPTELDPPADCEPAQTKSNQLPPGFLHYKKN